MIRAKSLKRILKSVGSPIVDLAGVYTRRIRKLTDARGSWTIVAYHRVIDRAALDPFKLGMCVMRQHFDAQIRYLKSAFNMVSVAECVRRLDSDMALPERALSVTFDDGYLDNLTHALPIMRKHGAPFTLFVSTGNIDCGETLWWDRVISAVACSAESRLDPDRLAFTCDARSLSLVGPYRAKTAEYLLARLWALPNAARSQAVRSIEGALKAPGTDQLGARRLTPHQIQDLYRQGVEIGAHSVGHGNLRTASADEVRVEMCESRSYLEQLLQARVEGFAYPGGFMSDETIAAARQQGFTYALATTVGANYDPFERFALRRIGMPDAPLADFRRAVSAALSRGACSNALAP